MEAIIRMDGDGNGVEAVDEQSEIQSSVPPLPTQAAQSETKQSGRSSRCGEEVVCYRVKKVDWQV